MNYHHIGIRENPSYINEEYLFYALLHAFVGLAELLEPEVSSRSGNEDTRECTEYYAQQHGERERTDAVATKHEDYSQHDERGDRSINGTSQCLVERIIEDEVALT